MGIPLVIIHFFVWDRKKTIYFCLDVPNLWKPLHVSVEVEDLEAGNRGLPIFENHHQQETRPSDLSFR
jgi:hypothetical protein